MKRKIIAAKTSTALTTITALLLMAGATSGTASAQSSRSAQSAQVTQTAPRSTLVLPWSSQVQSVYPRWVVGRTYHFTTRIQPAQIKPSAPPPAPPVLAVVASGQCRVSNFSATAWKPGKSSILTIRYDYTPLAEASGSGHVIQLLTKDKQLAASITHVSATAPKLGSHYWHRFSRKTVRGQSLLYTYVERRRAVK